MIDLFNKEMPQTKIITQPRGLAHYIGMTLLILVLSGFAQGILLIPFIFQNPDIETLTSDPMLNLMNLFLTSITIFAIFLIGRQADGRNYESFGLSRHHFVKHYLLGHVVGFIMISMALLVVLLLGSATYQGLHFSNPFYLFLYFIGFMIQGFEEELMCRGYMMIGLSKSKSMVFSVLANSIFFALLHLGNPGLTPLALINLCLAGVVFSALALYFDDLWVASGAHSMWNFAQGNLYGILVSGMSMGPTVFRFELNGPLSGGAFGLEGGIGVLLVEVGAIIVLSICYQKKRSYVCSIN